MTDPSRDRWGFGGKHYGYGDGDDDADSHIEGWGCGHFGTSGGSGVGQAPPEVNT